MTSVAYVCVKPFTIAKVDEDGFTVDSERVVAKKGSIWYLIKTPAWSEVQRACISKIPPRG